MGGHEARDYWEDWGLVLLMAGLLLPPTAWFLDLQASYAMIKWTCENDTHALLYLVPIGSLAIVAFAAWASWSSFVKLRDEATPEGGRLIDRSLLLAMAGLAMSGIFALMILTSYAPRYLLSPCQ